eukprot:CAMPEP_0117022156 /NCGR_PEP_ID=MMETSP0472-20121206/16680_1 /TAXON_ID=693140 ORGANISM="Tiarina fusus, Strain LIS" /NCGR_SAMPLE_ID=MMETSP0472 /ASSEMBLY_ACC=CAM_ASM_000603 /LENGTH=206 /DNA_ID=CAMNT_0004727931 /DNA_START=18 /DNA_END=638 /DNA_ORIENTATION=+
MPTTYSDKKPVLSSDDNMSPSSACTSSGASILHHHGFTYRFCDEQSFTITQHHGSTGQKSWEWKWNHTDEASRIYPYDHIPLAVAEPFQLQEWMARDLMRQHFVPIPVVEGNPEEAQAGGILDHKDIPPPLTVQWQCCDPHNNRPFLSGGIHYLTSSSRNPQHRQQPGYQIVLCSPKMCGQNSKKGADGVPKNAAGLSGDHNNNIK